MEWNGKQIKELGKEYRRQLGFMPQQQELYGNMTAQAFLSYIAALKCIHHKDALRQINEALDLVELSDAADKQIGGFSGDMKQRVLIANDILGDPSLIIMDEPTAGLDPKQRVMIRRLTQQLAENKIVIISTHIVSDIESIAKEIVMIQSGKLLIHGTVPELVQNVTNGEQTLENLYMQYYGGQ